MIPLRRAEAVLLAAVDLLLVAASFVWGYVLRFWFEVGVVTDVPPPPLSSYAEVLPLVLGVFFIVFRTRGLYDPYPPRGFDVFESSLRAVSFASVIVLAASFFYRELSYSRTVSVLAWGMLAVAVPIPRLLFLAERRRRYARGLDLLPAIIVGTERATDTSAPSSRRTYSAQEVLHRRLRDLRRWGLDVQGIVTRQPISRGELEGLPVLGTLPELERIVGAFGTREVLISGSLERLELLDVLERCERLGVEARVVPHIYDLFITARDLTELDGVPFVTVREQRLERWSLALKRVFDLVAGSALFLLALPIIGVLAFLIRRESSGPALFVQRRVGQGGRTFAMWKLRSMVVDAEDRLASLVDLDALEQPVFKLEDDPRVTRVGRWLRRWSLDELPQLWNVVRGDMSLVGPRPETEAIVARYDAHHRRRLKAKPGVTGLQQIEARAANDIDERVRLDVFYVRRRTFLFDLWILLRTPWAVIHGRGAV